MLDSIFLQTFSARPAIWRIGVSCRVNPKSSKTFQDRDTASCSLKLWPWATEHEKEVRWSEEAFSWKMLKVIQRYFSQDSKHLKIASIKLFLPMAWSIRCANRAASRWYQGCLGTFGEYVNQGQNETTGSYPCLQFLQRSWITGWFPFHVKSCGCLMSCFSIYMFNHFKTCWHCQTCPAMKETWSVPQVFESFSGSMMHLRWKICRCFERCCHFHAESENSPTLDEAPWCGKDIQWAQSAVHVLKVCSRFQWLHNPSKWPGVVGGVTLGVPKLSTTRPHALVLMKSIHFSFQKCDTRQNVWQRTSDHHRRGE